MNTFGSRLKFAREVAGLTQSELGRAVGMSQGQIGHLESGIRKKTTKLHEIAQALKVSAEWLLFGKDSDKQEPQESKELHLAYISNKEAQLLTWYREADDRSRLLVDDAARTADRRKADDFLGVVNGKSN